MTNCTFRELIFVKALFNSRRNGFLRRYLPADLAFIKAAEVLAVDELQNSFDIHRSVKVYVGVPLYKMNKKNNISESTQIQDTEWYNQFLLADMIRYGRQGGAEGFILFDYEDLADPRNSVQLENSKEVW